MAKKRTTKYQTYPQTYQFGGIPFLDQYQALNKQWSNFWKDGDYFNSAQLEDTITGNNNTSRDFVRSRNDLNTFTNSKEYTANKPMIDAYNAISENGVPFQSSNPLINNLYSSMGTVLGEQKDAFGNKIKDVSQKHENYQNEYNTFSKKQMSNFSNTAAGIFSGLNYINSYVPPEQINLQQGSKGVMYRQEGGNVNLTGYTPGTPTMNNPINEIPSGDIAMEQTPIPLVAIGKGGADNGLLKLLQPNSKGYNFKSKSTVEIPLEQQQQEQQISPEMIMAQQSQPTEQEVMAQYGKYINYNPLYAQMGMGVNPIYSMPFMNNMQIVPNPELEGANQQYKNDPNYIQAYIAAKENPNLFSNAYLLGAYKNLIEEKDKNNKLSIQALLDRSEFEVDKINNKNKKTNNKQFGGVARALQNIQSSGIMGNYSPEQAAYLQSISGEGAENYMNATPEFNAKMMRGYNPIQSQTQSAIPMIPGINPQIVEPMSGLGFNRDKMAAEMSANTNILTTKGDPWEYKKEGNIWKARKKGATNWITAKGDALSAIEQRFNAGVVQPKTGKTIIKQDTGEGYYMNPAMRGITNNTLSNIGVPESSYNLQVTDSNMNTGYNVSSIPDISTNNITPNSNYQQMYPVGNYPNFGAPVGTLSQEDQDGVYAGSMAALSMIPIGGALSAGITYLPKVGKVVQYGEKFIDKAGNYISKSGSKLGKASKEAVQKANKFFENDWIEQAKRNPNYFTPMKPAQAVIQNSRFAAPQSTVVRNAWTPVPKQYGGYIPQFQFGGSVNDQHAIPIFSSNLEDFGLTELQTEKDEVAFMPDGSVVDVKAKELHKKQDKHNVSDIMQSGTYVFSNDPKMKFGVKSKIGGVELGDMKLGKSVFKYKENEITPGPEDIMLKDMFFNNSKKELTTAEIAKNIKKNLPIVDLKNDYFADRAIAENKDQRLEYLSVLKAFNEYKKPKQRSIPKAQYGMPIQPTQNGLDGVMGYGDKQMDPFKRMDNNIISMFNFKTPPLPAIPKMYEDGGMVPQAQFGWAADGLDSIFGWSNRAKKEQERKNRILAQEAQGYRDELQQGVDRAGTLGVGTNLATYAASLNVPLQRYDDQSEQMAMYNAAANRATQRLEASKYTASQGIGGASTLARYSNPINYGDYLAKVQSQSDGNIGRLNQAIADLDMQRANANIGFTDRRNAGRNQSLNARDTQVYNANVTGIGNVGRSMQEATFNSADTRYRMGSEKMAYDAYLEDKAKAAKQAKQQQIRGYANEIGQLGLTYATGGFGGDNLFAKNSSNTSGQPSYNFNGNPNSFSYQNSNQQFQQSPANQQFNYGNLPTYNTINPGGFVDRSGTFISGLPGINPMTGRPWGQ